jgi:hypothetical protein
MVPLVDHEPWFCDRCDYVIRPQKKETAFNHYKRYKTKDIQQIVTQVITAVEEATKLFPPSPDKPDTQIA